MEHNLKSIRTLIEMNNKQDEITVEDDEFGCQVYHSPNGIEHPARNVYECKNIDVAYKHVNDLLEDSKKE